MKRISLEKFIEKTKGTQVDVPWKHKKLNLKGNCVSLIQCYINDCLGQVAKARGNAKEWINTYVNENLGKIVDVPKKGDILVFPNDGVVDGIVYGHIAIYVDGKLYDQNNLRHDEGFAGFGEIYSNDYVILRPNVDLIEENPNEKYLNLYSSVDSWRIYKLNHVPVVGNECGFLYPKRFNGLSYTLKGYTQPDVAIIETRDFGKVQIYIKSKYAIITNKPMYDLVK